MEIHFTVKSSGGHNLTFSNKTKALHTCQVQIPMREILDREKNNSLFRLNFPIVCYPNSRATYVQHFHLHSIFRALSIDLQLSKHKKFKQVLISLNKHYHLPPTLQLAQHMENPSQHQRLLEVEKQWQACMFQS